MRPLTSSAVAKNTKPVLAPLLTAAQPRPSQCSDDGLMGKARFSHFPHRGHSLGGQSWEDSCVRRRGGGHGSFQFRGVVQKPEPGCLASPRIPGVQGQALRSREDVHGQPRPPLCFVILGHSPNSDNTGHQEAHFLKKKKKKRLKMTNLAQHQPLLNVGGRNQKACFPRTLVFGNSSPLAL